MSDHSAPAAEMPQRKRQREDGHASSRRAWLPQPPPPQSASEPTIQYLVDGSRLPRLDLVPGDLPEVSDIFRTIDAYEYVLARHESLAACLGAQMTSPKLVKALDNIFEGTITIVDQAPNNNRPQPTWMEVVAFAKANPDIFVLTTVPDSGRCCQFTIRDCYCSIIENDWRLIISGAVDRFTQEAPEDEAAELATVEILEDRLQTLIMNADKVAEKARQLNYRLSGRKAGIKARLPGPNRGEGAGPATQPFLLSYDIKGDLLNQFTTRARSAVFSEQVDELMYCQMQSYPDGGIISPPCDLCRKRKNAECLKNATACEECTKRHAKCTWRDVTHEEALVIMNLEVLWRRGAIRRAAIRRAEAGAEPRTNEHPLYTAVRRDVEARRKSGTNRDALPGPDAGQVGEETREGVN